MRAETLFQLMLTLLFAVGVTLLINSLFLKLSSYVVARIRVPMARASLVMVFPSMVVVGLWIWLMMAPYLGPRLVSIIAYFVSIWASVAFLLKDSKGKRVGGFVGFLIAAVIAVCSAVISLVFQPRQ